jgi:hypothetical protein
MVVIKKIMGNFSVKGKGYKVKLIGFSESVPAFLFYKILNLHKLLSQNAIKRKSDTVFMGNWLVNYSELAKRFSQFCENRDNALQDAQKIIDRNFCILGWHLNYSGKKINWHLDPKNNFEWKKYYYKRLYPVAKIGNNRDCKMPWELCRFQHLTSFIRGYFLTDEDDRFVDEAVQQIAHWISDNPFPYGVNWTCAMEVSIRACNWIWAWQAFREHPAWNDDFNQQFLRSLWQHGRFIRNNLENKGGIRTNHYLSDIAGLLFIGLMFPQFRDAEKWKQFGIRELIRSMDEMVYPDGVSFENSTAYHRFALELFAYSAILCKKNDIDLPESFWKRLEKMFEFIMYCTRPDGRMPMIGDADDGRFFIFSDYYEWDRWDFRYLLSIGSVLFNRQDFKKIGGKCHIEAAWLLGQEGVSKWEKL